MAAKKSRDQRKFREEAIAQRAEALERENAMLRTQVTALKEEVNSLQGLLLQKRIRGAVDERDRNSNGENDEIIDLSS